MGENKNDKIFECFSKQLEDYTKTKAIPKLADADMQYQLELQRKRLEKKNISMEYHFEPRGQFADKGGPGRTWSDMRYESNMEYRTTRMTRRFEKGEKQIYKKAENMTFYQTITDVQNQEMVLEDLHECPNCGAITKIGLLQKGCPYCRTCFQIPDIFPKVTGYYFIKDAGYTEKEVKKSVAAYMVVTGLLLLLGYTVYHYFFNPRNMGNLPGSIVDGLFAGVFGGVVLGYLLWAIVHIGMIFFQAGKTMPMMPTVGSGARFVKRMRQYSPAFSYEYFSNKVVSMLKMVFFADKPEELPIYKRMASADAKEDTWANVVDIDFAGAVGLKKFVVEGNICTVCVNVFLDTLYDRGKYLKKKREKYLVRVQRDISVPIDYAFSIRHVECKSCGSSFDATRQKTCPACDSVYDMADGDWVITRIEKSGTP